jgi:hypothetical protein
MRDEINNLTNMINMGLKLTNRCFVSTKDAPQKSMAKKRVRKCIFFIDFMIVNKKRG